MFKRRFTLAALALLLCQCNTLKSDCQALAEREAQIAQEPQGDYFVGRRYYIPYTRLWGYLREPGKSWRTAKLVMMDEHVVRQPDRGIEPPQKNAVYGTDKNVEYIVRGRFMDKDAYDSATDRPYPLFQATGFEVRNRKPGFLFKPSEKYDEKFVTLKPDIMPAEGVVKMNAPR